MNSFLEPYGGGEEKKEPALRWQTSPEILQAYCLMTAGLEM